MSLKTVAVAASALACFAFPMMAEASTSYVVKPGDSLWKISHRMGISVQQLAQENHISQLAYVEVGQKLTLSTAPKQATKTVATTKHTAARKHSAPFKVDQVVHTAQRLIGVRYVWGGTTPKGFDCSGFTQYVFAKNGIHLPRVSSSQWKVGKSIPSSQLKKGDLVFFGNTYRKGVSHIGIYLGNDKFIEASSSHGVTVANLFKNSYWRAHYFGARDVLND